MGGQNATRVEIEAGICIGRIKKLKQGVNGDPSQYKKVQVVQCSHWTYIGVGRVLCTCPDKKFNVMKKDSIKLNEY